MSKEGVVRKWYRIARARIKDPTSSYVNYARAYRLLVGKAKWRGNAESPVCLMIDDLTNAWFDANRNGRLEIGEDWGGRFYEQNSALDFLNRSLLREFPEIKTTFFVVVGAMSPFHTSTPFTSANSVDATKESSHFFRSIHFNERSELAYHGFDHGNPGDNDRPFFQEWENIGSVEQSLEKIKKGGEIFAKTFGEKPRGGKTGAYVMNPFVEQSIDSYGFSWWCRNWTNKCLREKANLILFDPKFFGNNRVIDLPSTVHGSVWYRSQIKNLIEDRQIVSVQEHISPLGVDGRAIKPNIVDDLEELRRLFRYLRRYHVWHATLSEIAEYFEAFSFSHVLDAQQSSFQLMYEGSSRCPLLTLLIDPYCLMKKSQGTHLRITLPDGSLLSGSQIRYDNVLDVFLADVPVLNGVYHVEMSDSPLPPLKGRMMEDGMIQYNASGMTGFAEIEVPRIQHERFFLFRNGGQQRPIRYAGPGKVRGLCLNSSSDDRLVEVDACSAC